MAETRALEVLFLCTGNSARSIIAEALLNHRGGGRFRAHSAGSRPSGRVHPQSLALLRELGIPIADARSKSWEEFASAHATPLDFIITVCDNAAGEACPIWPGHPMTAHWGVEDPAAATGTQEEVAEAFRHAGSRLAHRIDLFIALPFGKLDAQQIRERLRAIGST